MATRVPDGQSVTLSALPIALWCSDFTPGTFPEDRAKQKRFEAAFRPVAGAFVACVKVADASMSLPVAAWNLRCGRTNDFGWVLTRQRGALGEEGHVPRSGWKKKAPLPGGVADPLAVPADAGIEAYPDITDAMDAGVPAPEDLSTFAPEDAAMLELDSSDANAEAMSVLPNQRYRLVWCYGEALFERFLEAYDLDPVKALGEYEAAEYVVEPFRARTAVSQLRDFSPHEQAFVARVLSSGPEGYHGGWPSLDGMAAAIFDATPNTLRKLYLCEWLHWTCLHMVRNDPHWPYLLALRSVIRAARSGAAIPDLAARMPSDDIVGRRAAQMRGYLLNLAKSGVKDRGLVRAVVDVWGVSRMHAPWRTVADAFADRYGEQHPLSLDPLASAQDFRFTESERDALVAYFDMYALGVRRDSDLEALDAHWQHAQQALEWLQQRQATLIGTVSHVALDRAVARNVPPQENACRIELVKRFHQLAAIHQVRFWEQANITLGSQSAWDAHRPFVAWMADGADTLSEVFEHFVERFLARYKNLSAKSFEAALQYLYRYHLALSAKRYDQTLPAHDVIVRLEPDLARGKVVAKLVKGQTQTVLVEMELLTRVQNMPAQEAHRPLGAAEPGTGFKRYRRAVAKAQVRELKMREATVRVFNPDAPALESFPKLLARAGALIEVSVAAGELASAMKSDLAQVDGELYLNMVQETLAAFEHGADLIAPVLNKLGAKGAQLADGLVIGGRVLSRAAMGLEGVRNVVAGGTTIATLLAPEKADTDLARYLDRGEGLPALLEATKGLVQVAAGGSAVGAIVVGAGTTVATLSLGAWVSVGLVTIAMRDVLIHVETGGESPTRAFENEAFQARRAEFFSKIGRILKPDEKVTVETSNGPREQRATCLLARRLGLVNQVLKA